MLLQIGGKYEQKTRTKVRQEIMQSRAKSSCFNSESTDTEETVIPTAEPAIIKEVAQPEPKKKSK